MLYVEKNIWGIVAEGNTVRTTVETREKRKTVENITKKEEMKGSAANGSR